MQEIELKVLNINVREITKKLLSLGAKKIGTKLLIDQQFDFPDGRIVKSGSHLRLRQNGKQAELTYKGARKRSKNFKMVEETQTDMADREAMEIILKKLGLERIKYHEKKRTSFEYKKLKLEIDAYPGIPPLLELEGTQKDIKQMLQRLHIPLHATCTLNVNRVIKLYRKNNKLLRF